MSGEVALEEGEAICGKAARFSSASGFFKLDEFPSVLPSGNDALTVVVRYRPDSVQSSEYFASVVMWGDAGGWQSGKLFKAGVGHGRLESVRSTFCGWVGTPGGLHRTDMATDRSRWMTVALVYSPEKSLAKIFVDGEFVDQRFNVTGDIAAENFAVGSSYAGTQNFNGLIDDVRIYGSALSTGQIRLIAERLEASKGVAGGASAPASTLLRRSAT